jgi:Ca2+-binding EF-hand superfamily protein
MNESRLRMVRMAFEVIDGDRSGVLDMQDVVSKYNASKHPDVISGRRSAGEVLREFLDTFDVGGEKDGKVTLAEFENYYSNISASVDDDVYFELMIRNAWRISGGEGQAANTSNRRVLVVNEDGFESVREVTNDLGIGSKDKAAMAARLGVRADQLGLTFGTKESSGGKGAPPGRLAASNRGTQPAAAPVAPAVTGGRRRVESIASTSSGTAAAITGGSSLPESGFVPAAEYDILSTRQKLQDGRGALDELRRALLSQGLPGLVGLQKRFKLFDADNSGMLSEEEFQQAVIQTGIRVSQEQLHKLFLYFDKDGNGSVTLDEFLSAVRVSGSIETYFQ